MDSLENFSPEIEEELEHLEWLLLTLDYLIFIVLYAGALFTLLLFLSFMKNFYTRVTNLYGAYFYILSIGYFVDFCSVIIFTLSTFIFPECETIIHINNLIQWYAKLFVGFWNSILVLNRFTALLFWNKQEKIWSEKPLFCIIFLMLAYPFIINGYQIFGNVHCALNSYNKECTDFIVNLRHFMAIANGTNAVVSLIFSLITAFSGRLNIVKKLSTVKLEKRLLIQALISTLIFGSYCILTAVYSLLYPLHNININYALAYDVTLDLGNLFYMIFHYSSAVLLIIVSASVRKRFLQFYYLHKVFGGNKVSDTSVIHITRLRST